jgi:hypothetical protein
MAVVQHERYGVFVVSRASNLLGGRLPLCAVYAIDMQAML